MILSKHEKKQRPRGSGFPCGTWEGAAALAGSALTLSLLRRLPYSEFFGGVSGLTVEQFQKINGFPNAFWGWGGEDDDLWNRYGLGSASFPDLCSDGGSASRA